LTQETLSVDYSDDAAETRTTATSNRHGHFPDGLEKDAETQ